MVELAPLLCRYYERNKTSLTVTFLKNALQSLTPHGPIEAWQIKELALIYEPAIRDVELQMASNGYRQRDVQRYQGLFQELEGFWARAQNDSRHNFLIVIPVADRPQHLKRCLTSILTLCQAFRYGGTDGAVFKKVKVLIADDSAEPDNIAQNQTLAVKADGKGLATRYLGWQEQVRILDKLDEPLKRKLIPFIGNVNKGAFYHKGPSVMRNVVLTILKNAFVLDSKTLIYFIDSDQEFKVRVQTQQGFQEVVAINYFYQLDVIFSTGQLDALTGKVVGDPPVSPAVMAGRLLRDVVDFFQTLHDANQLEADCPFHRDKSSHLAQALYHDMAELFGFPSSSEPARYQCRLNGAHTIGDCFIDFADKLNGFFYGFHPTRSTTYEYENALKSLKPARTVYTGNYVLAPNCLDYLIPFATLGLRMAGPTLGRLLRAKKGARFCQANLPMLHNRTLDDHTVGYRAGVSEARRGIDLSGEIKKQFFGDVVLFAIETLIAKGYPNASLNREAIYDVLMDTDQKIRGLYQTKQEERLKYLGQLIKLIQVKRFWQNGNTRYKQAAEQCQFFLTNMIDNFGARSTFQQLINTETKDFQSTYQEIALSMTDYGESTPM